MNYSLQFLESIKIAEDTTRYEEINIDFKTQNDELSQMFIKQDKGIQDLKPCLVSLQRTNEQSSNLLEPIQHLINEVMQTILHLQLTKIKNILLNKINFINKFLWHIWF